MPCVPLRANHSSHQHAERRLAGVDGREQELIKLVAEHTHLSKTTGKGQVNWAAIEANLTFIWKTSLA
jgi:hypothetical protein